ncbi:MAG: DsrH/TusB family sulfur relay protein [Gammaproteobacteria bacterium]|nr:DsrH/TusB family sulfur relay protein [Gammaproteobacteria bacterium]
MKLITLIQPTLSLPDLTAICQPEDGILLRQDAVWLSVRQDISWPVQHVYALQSDLLLRGLPEQQHIKIIDDATWVALTIQAQQVLLWQN